MFRSKSRGQVIGEELSEGFSHVRSAASEASKATAEAVGPRVEAAREALAPRVEAAVGALAPRVDAAREAIAPRVEATREALSKTLETTREQAEHRLADARSQAEHRLADVRAQAGASREDLTESSRRAAKKTAKKAKKNAKKAKKFASSTRKDARTAVADAKAEAKRAALAAKPGKAKKRRRWPWLLAVIAVGGVIFSRSRSKTEDDLWGTPSDSPVAGYTEDPTPTTVGQRVDEQKATAPQSTDGPLHGKLADASQATGAAAGESPKAQQETADEAIAATEETGTDPGDNPRHAAADDENRPT